MNIEVVVEGLGGQNFQNEHSSPSPAIDSPFLLNSATMSSTPKYLTSDLECYRNERNAVSDMLSSTLQSTKIVFSRLE